MTYNYKEIYMNQKKNKIRTLISLRSTYQIISQKRDLFLELTSVFHTWMP